MRVTIVALATYRDASTIQKGEVAILP